MVRPALAALACTMLLAGCVTPPDLASLDTAVRDRKARIPATLAGTTFGRAVSASVAQSPTLGRGDAALQEAEAGLLAQEGAFLPRLSVGLRPGDMGFRLSSFASISQLIYDGGASAAGLTAAGARVLGGVAGRSEAASRAAMAAVTAWADVATARHLVRAAEASLSALEATVAQIEERAAAGAGSSAETLTARSRLANERAAVVAARSEVARAEAVFIEVFSQTPAIKLDLPPLAPAPPGESPPAPVILQAEAALLAADADLAAAEAARLPSLSLTVSAVPGADAVAGLASEQLLAPSRGRAARVAAAEARVAARRTDLDATRRELASRQRIMAAERAAVSERLTASVAASEANRENLAATRAQFEIGRRSLLELLDAEREALSSERQRILAAHDRAVLGYAMLALTGDLLDAFGILLPARETETAPAEPADG